MYHGYTETKSQSDDRKTRIQIASALRVPWYGRSLDEIQNVCPDCGGKIVLDNHESESYICNNCFRKF